MEKRFNIKDIIAQKLDEPVPLFGDENLRCAELYNAIWEKYCWDNEFFRVAKNKIKDDLRPLARFLTAILYMRWAHQSDVNIEPELQIKIYDALTKYDFLNMPFDSYRPWFSDHNEDDLIFSSDELLSNWVGEILIRVARDLTNFDSVSSHGNNHDNDFIWMYKEYPDSEDPRPCFKTQGWDATVNEILGELGLLYYSISYGINVELIKREDVLTYSWEQDMQWQEFFDFDQIQEVFHKGNITPDNCVALVVDSDDYAHVVGYDLVEFLDTLLLLDDNTEYFLVFSAEMRSKTNQNRIKQLIDKLGLRVLAAPSVENDLYNSTLYGKITTQYLYRSRWEYLDEITDELSEQFDRIFAFQEAMTMLENMLVVSSKENEVLFKLYTQFYKRPNEKLKKEYCIEAIKALTFGDIDLTDAVELFENKYIFTTRTGIIHNLYKDRQDKHKVLPVTPRRDALHLLNELYKQEGIFTCPDENLFFDTIIDDDDDDKEDDMEKLKEAIEQRYQQCAKAGMKAGMQYALDALRNGVPIDDILA